MATQELHIKQPKAESYKGIYSTHKYWSKKPHNIIRHFIKTYSQKNDIVMDPFCGSGISNIEAILSGRKTVGIDINPAAIFITEQLLVKVKPSVLKQEFLKIKDECHEKINTLYKIKRGKMTFTATHFLYHNGSPVEVWYKDKFGKKIVQTPTKSDINQLRTFSYDKIKEFYPTDDLIPNSRINTKTGMHVYDLFTPRNLQALAISLNHINKIRDKKLENCSDFVLLLVLDRQVRWYLL